MYPVSSRTGEDDLAGVGACFAKDTPPRVLAAPRSIKQVAPRELVGGVVRLVLMRRCRNKVCSAISEWACNDEHGR